VRGKPAPNYTAETVVASEEFKELQARRAPPRTAEIHGPAFVKDLQANSKLHGCVNKAALSYANVLASYSMTSLSQHKVLDNRITALQCLRSDNVVVVAGDKTGQMAVLKVDGKLQSYAFKPFSDVVSMIKTTEDSFFCSCYNGKLVQVSVDNYKKKDVVYARTGGSYEDNRLYCFDFDSTAMNTGFVSHGDGTLRRIDVRVPGATVGSPFTVHDKKVGFVHCNPVSPHLLATCSLDRTIKVWDARKMGKAGCNLVTLEDASLSINHATWSPDGTKLLSCSMDHHVRVHYTPQDFTEGALVPTCEFPHFNKTGRWLTKFQGVWDPKNSSVFYYGCLQQPRQMEAFVCVDGVSRPVSAAAPKQAKGTQDKENKENKEEETEAEQQGDDFFECRTAGAATKVTQRWQGSGVFRLMQFQDEDYLGSVQSLIAPHHKKHFLAGANSSGRISFFKAP